MINSLRINNNFANRTAAYREGFGDFIGAYVAGSDYWPNNGWTGVYHFDCGRIEFGRFEI